MSLSFASLILFKSEELCIVKVQSSLCHYRVAISEDSARVQGPGVDHEIDMKAQGISGYPPEALAIMAVILFEGEE